MADQVFGSHGESRWLEQVREGMRVYDRNGKEVGTVGQVYFGAPGTDVDEGPGGPAQTPSPLDSVDDESFDEGLANARGTSDFMPDVLRKRLEKQGFLQLRGGVLSPDRYALPGQIGSVAGDRVQLNVPEDQLIKR